MTRGIGADLCLTHCGTILAGASRRNAVAKFESVRVLTGANKSRKLSSRVSGATRPTSARVRKSVFDILGSRFGIEGMTVLDLFAGTGALGIEALSRGARYAWFVDRSRESIRTIRENLMRLDVAQERYQVVTKDYGHFLGGYFEERFDIAFLDPPYAFSEWKELLAKVPATVMVCESASPVETPGGLEKLLERKYGTTLVTLIIDSKSGS